MHKVLVISGSQKELVFFFYLQFEALFQGPGDTLSEAYTVTKTEVVFSMQPQVL